MPGGALFPAGSLGAHVEAPVTVKTYLMCAFAAFGGIFFGYGLDIMERSFCFSFD